jgi:hypothetical protein
MSRYLAIGANESLLWGCSFGVGAGFLEALRAAGRPLRYRHGKELVLRQHPAPWSPSASAAPKRRLSADHKKVAP